MANLWIKYFKCANHASDETLYKCSVYLNEITALNNKLTSLFAITLTDLEKQQVDMYLNQAQ